MKKLFLSIAVLALTCVAFSSCDDDKCTCTYKYMNGETDVEEITEDQYKKAGFSNCSEIAAEETEEGYVTVTCK